MSAESNSQLAWKNDLHGEWIKARVPSFLSQNQIDFGKYFLLPLDADFSLENPYRNSIWKVLPNSAIPLGVLHCYPKVIGTDRVIWEEWFVLNGEIRHHILSNKPLHDEDGVWTPAPDDKDHPTEVLNSSWHYRISKDLRPFHFES